MLTRGIRTYQRFRIKPKPLVPKVTSERRRPHARLTTSSIIIFIFNQFSTYHRKLVVKKTFNLCLYGHVCLLCVCVRVKVVHFGRGHVIFIPPWVLNYLIIGHWIWLESDQFQLHRSGTGRPKISIRGPHKISNVLGTP